MPSLWQEAFGLVAVEAQLRGIPVVSTDACGLSEANFLPELRVAGVEIVFDSRTREVLRGVTLQEAERSLDPRRAGPAAVGAPGAEEAERVRRTHTCIATEAEAAGFEARVRRLMLDEPAARRRLGAAARRQAAAHVEGRRGGLRRTLAELAAAAAPAAAARTAARRRALESVDAGFSAAKAELQMKEVELREVAAALELTVGDSVTADLVRALLPALCALVRGETPDWLAVLRRNVALHAEAPAVASIASAGPAALRKAQKGPRLGHGRGRRCAPQPGARTPLRSTAQPFCPAAVADPVGLPLGALGVQDEEPVEEVGNGTESIAEVHFVTIEGQCEGAETVPHTPLAGGMAGPEPLDVKDKVAALEGLLLGATERLNTVALAIVTAQYDGTEVDQATHDGLAAAADHLVLLEGQLAAATEEAKAGFEGGDHCFGQVPMAEYDPGVEHDIVGELFLEEGSEVDEEAEHGIADGDGGGVVGCAGAADRRPPGPWADRFVFGPEGLMAAAATRCAADGFGGELDDADGGSGGPQYDGPQAAEAARARDCARLFAPLAAEIDPAFGLEANAWGAGGSASSARRGAGGRLSAPSWLSCLCAAEPARADNQGRGTAAPQSLGEALRARLRRCLPWASSEGPAAADPLVRPVQRRWYRLHPLAADITFFVRPDAGLRGRQPGFTASLQRALAVSHYAMAASEAGIFQKKLERKGDVRTLESRWKGGLGGRKKLQLSWSVPNFVERRWMLDGSSWLPVRRVQKCMICYEQPAELILLPCRHGGLCEDPPECLRLTFLSRPKHRGGHNCPFCRRRSTEVLQICAGIHTAPRSTRSQSR
ncbi:unnamed protein product [Prorocentrum cordatum]|uniref:RING-type domain-containing protein n=1 Tax=Prorocentrum cordatum TaxID=2364126 RepID=A0ABN9TJ42_9DINO|nr:unnamed protein product [Polarella glacialis]